jgi:hypothetical protein
VSFSQKKKKKKESGKGIGVKENSPSKDMETQKCLLCAWDYKEFQVSRAGRRRGWTAGKTQFMASLLG